MRQRQLWRLYTGKFSNISPCKACLHYLGILPITALSPASQCYGIIHTQPRGPAPGPSLSTACQRMRNFRSFCNNFWNLHAFLNSLTHFSLSLLWKGLWIKLPGMEKWNLAFAFCVWAGLAVYSWLNASTVFSKIWLLYTLESTPWLVAETSRGSF